MKFISNIKSLFILTTVSLYGYTGLSHADDNQLKVDRKGFIIIGPARINEYLGSSDYEMVPMIISQFQLLGSDIEIEGLTARGSLLNGNNWHTGIATRFDFGRDGDVSNQAVAAMKTLDANVNFGGYISQFNESTWLDGDKLEFRIEGTTDMSGSHQGVITTLTSTYTLPLYIPWRFEFELEASYASSNYMQSYFGIDAIDSGASGLAQYQAGSSLRDITFNTNIGLFVSPTWGAFVRLSYTRLLGSAADSPIVKGEGSVNQSLIGLGVFYRF
jgi:outer membrane scaffolding protein for murein synthesis (MipA/OmpV family)